MVKFITRIIDFFYIKPFRFIPIDTFRYAAVGGGNMLVGYVFYWICFNFILRKLDINLGFVVISAPVFSFLLTSALNLLLGFWLTRNIAFKSSPLKGRTQLMRYFSVFLINLFINYAGLKLLVEVLGFYPTPSYVAISIITVIFSYLLQRNYTFKGHKGSE